MLSFLICQIEIIPPQRMLREAPIILSGAQKIFVSCRMLNISPQRPSCSLTRSALDKNQPWRTLALKVGSDASLPLPAPSGCQAGTRWLKALRREKSEEDPHMPGNPLPHPATGSCHGRTHQHHLRKPLECEGHKRSYSVTKTVTAPSRLEPLSPPIFQTRLSMTIKAVFAF